MDCIRLDVCFNKKSLRLLVGGAHVSFVCACVCLECTVHAEFSNPPSDLGRSRAHICRKGHEIPPTPKPQGPGGQRMMDLKTDQQLMVFQ